MPRKPKGHLLSLAACHRELLSAHEAEPASRIRPPSLVQLKRWSAAGQLNHARRQAPGAGEGGRDRFDLEAVRRVCDAWGQAQERKRVTRPLAAVAKADKATPSADLEESKGTGRDLSVELAAAPTSLVSENPSALSVREGQIVNPELVALLSGLQTQISDLKAQITATQERLAQVDDLRHIASTLMRKYDSENALLRQKAESLTAQVARLTESSNPVEVGKLNVKLQMILDAIGRIG